jgi:hypothetical protein
MVFLVVDIFFVIFDICINSITILTFLPFN